MRRLPVFLTVLALILVGVTATSRPESATAQQEVNFVGSWQVRITRDDGVTLRALASFTEGGVVILVGQPVVPAPPGGDPGVIFNSTALGAWEMSGSDSSGGTSVGTANVTFIHWRSGADGQPLGTISVSANLTIPPGQPDFFIGPAVSTIADASGSVIAEVTSRWEATRIFAKAPVMPDLNATPTS